MGGEVGEDPTIRIGEVNDYARLLIDLGLRNRSPRLVEGIVNNFDFPVKRCIVLGRVVVVSGKKKAC